jgi:hypothetical protein
MKPNEYTWKIGPQFSSNITLRTNKPVTQNTVASSSVMDCNDDTSNISINLNARHVNKVVVS